MLQKIGNDFKRPALLKNLLSNQDISLNHYSIIYTTFDNEKFLKSNIDSLNLEVFCAYTNKEDILKDHPNATIIPIMLGKLIKDITNNERVEIIGINPNNGHFANFIFAPFFDNLTKKHLISPSDESIALLSIDNKTHDFMGVEASFFSINNKFLPEDREQREELLGNLVDDLSFMISRISQPIGSANIICLLLNLENPVEEKAFIRRYETLDKYITVLFVDSDLKLVTGDLQEVQYNGENLEGVYSPIINLRDKNPVFR